MLELDDDGLRYYDLVILIVPRQQGKTTMVDAVLVWAPRRGHDLDVAYTAQDRQMARDRLLEQLVERRLDRSPYAGQYTVRRSNGSERVKWRTTGSRVVVTATDADAGHGLTIDTGILDEAFAHRDLTISNAYTPTMVTRPDPQLWVTSTVGDGTDGLLMHYQEIGRASLHDPDTRVAYFEWSATDDDDRMSPAVWRRVMPALGHTITEARIRSYAKSMPPAEFDRGFLCRRPVASLTAALDLEAWAECAHPDPSGVDLAGPVAVAFHITPDRTHGTVAVAGIHDDRPTFVVERRPGTRWIADTVLELVNRPTLYVTSVAGDRRAGVGGIIDHLVARGVDVNELGAGDVSSRAGTLADYIAGRELWHAAQSELDTQAADARPRRLGEAWAFDALKSDGPVDAVVAASFAVGGLLANPTGAGGIT